MKLILNLVFYQAFTRRRVLTFIRFLTLNFDFAKYSFMQLEKITSGIGDKAFALLKNGRRLLTFAFHAGSNAARIEFENEKRVFLFRREGLLRNRIVLYNEYGVRLGRTGIERGQRYIDINNDRYFIRLNEKESSGELTIYQQSASPLAVCSVDKESEDPGLLMVLCWYLFKPAALRQPAI
ncbi:hypothetical protein JMG10_06305 [Nostoc ellipsosporum NOK]|nr:hypothetical protein [Nostoc ellipsosporum NOK]